MSTTSVEFTCTSQGGKLILHISELSSDVASNTSQVRVWGTLRNDNSTTTSAHNNPDITNFSKAAGTGGSVMTFNGAKILINLEPGESSAPFADHTFTVPHSSDGTGNADCQVGFGTTNTTIFGNNKSVSGSLTLTTLAHEAGSPTDVTISNILPTSARVSWTAPDDNGGAPVTSYKVDVYTGDTAFVHFFGSYRPSGTALNLTNLKAGQDYTVLVYAFNGHGSDGFSDPSGPETFQTLAGGWIRVDGVWHAATPYVRTGGVWKMALPYIRVGGVWQPTH